MTVFQDIWSQAWSVAGVIIVAVLMMEFLPDYWKAVARKFRFGRMGKPDYRALAEAYHGEEWQKQYYSDFWEKMGVDWARFTAWQQRPCQTDFFNFNDRGLRVTANPKLPQEIKPYRIYMFGGSTTVGLGARDNATLPSHLARRIFENGMPVEITNFAQLGHSSTQEIIAFIQMLKADECPDMVIFYDGANEVIPSEQTGEADSLFNEHHRNAEFNILHQSQRKNLIGYGIRAMIPRLMRRIGSIPGQKTHQLQDVTQLPGVKKDDIELLSRKIAVSYISNIKFAHLIAAENGISSLFFVQPMLFSKKTRSPHEEKYILDGAVKPSLRIEYFSAAYAAIRHALKEYGNASAIDISELFDDVNKPIYIDPFHVSENGNDMIAEAMLPYVMELLTKN
jgi:lysophospholipase L1-like esterase